MKTTLMAFLSLVAGTLLAAEPAYDTLIAHRGESVDAPENTLPAYKTAVERGFGFECDVYLSADKRVFTFHDGDLRRTTNGACTNKCAEANWETVISKTDVGGWGEWKGSKFSPTRPALLEELLPLAVDGRQIYIEIKPGPEIVPYVKAIFAKQSKATPKNALFISFNKASCAALKREMPDYKVFWLSCAHHRGGPLKGKPVTPAEVMAALRETKADGVDFQFNANVVTADFVRRIREAGYEFHVWTVDKLSDTRLAFARGVQTVTTNCAKKQLDEYLAAKQGAAGIPPTAASVWIGENPAPAVVEQANLVGHPVRAILPKNCPRFRKRFALPTGKVAEARVHVAGLGGYELWLNGAKVDSDRVMSPGWSNPDDRILADRYDVQSGLRPGATNVVGVWLSPGYSDDFNVWSWRWLHPKALNLTLEVRYEDGRRFRLESDKTWEWTDDQPITAASIYNGETYDATKEDPDWAAAEGSAATWRPVGACAAPKGRLEPNPGPAVRLCDPVAPQAAQPLPNGGWLLDFGVNRAGVVGWSAKLKRGAKVVIQCSDEAKDGRLDLSHCRGAAQRDTYIASGVGIETYRPRFTYHGFRYAEITGLDAEAVKSVRAWAVQAAIRETASFRSSDETLNWLWESSLRTMRGNLLTYPSDCYTRGERTPCLMDSQVFEDVAMTAFDMREFYGKWLHDAAHYELSVDPKVGNNGNPDWAGEPIALAARLVRKYGSIPAVESEYPRLREIAETFCRCATNGLWRTGFGDWCAPNREGSYHSAFASVALVNSALLCVDLRDMAFLASAFGKGEDARHFTDEFERCRAAFLKAFHRPEASSFAEGRQCDLILPLALGLVPESARQQTTEALLARIRTVDHGKIGTGIYGTRHLGDVLLDAGQGDLWLGMLRGPDYPSFGFMRKNGATSLWEQWCKDGGMTSHSHAMYSGAATCLMTHLAGIRTKRHEARDFVIRPCFPTQLEWVVATQNFAAGEVRVDWRREKGKVSILVSLPNGTAGKLVLHDRTVPLSAGENRIAL